MTCKQLFTRNEIAKIDGESKAHFLTEHARRRNKSLYDVAGLVARDVCLIQNNRCVCAQRRPIVEAHYLWVHLVRKPLVKPDNLTL